MIMNHPYYHALLKGCDALGLALCDEQLHALLRYQDALVLWNKAYNLTAIRHPDEMLVKHLLDSLSILPHLPEGRLLDIGTGGGMPGMMIALCQPKRHCVLLDSNGKKIRFLKQFIADQKLANVQAIQTRVEDQHAIDALGKFDVITSRAFASLIDFVRAAEPYLAAQGTIAARKGLIPEDELNQLHDYQQHVIALKVPNLDEQRHLICLKPTQ